MATRTQLVIEGDLVTQVTFETGASALGPWSKKTTGRSVRIEDWLAAYMAAQDEMIFVPQMECGQMIARKSFGEKECVIVEMRPALHRLLETISGNPRARQLAFPWVYLAIRFVGGAVDYIRVFYRNEKAFDASAELFWPNLPNVYKDGKLCTGTISGCRPTDPMVKRLDWIVRSFWDSQFNNDLSEEHYTPSKGLTNHPQTFAEWEEMSATDPMFILGIQWRSSGLTIQQVLDRGVV